MRSCRHGLTCQWTSTIALSDNGPLDRSIAPAEAQHPGQSAFRLVIEGTEAFAIRAHTARRAVRSLDVQTYIWHADLTGLFLAQQLIDAADRGVRVRLLVDDMDARAKNAGFAALAAHPNIDVRLFNPFASRAGVLRFIGEGLTDFGRVNRRMHNKSWIADNRIALVGGRNIGDEYYGASDGVNFVDLDFVMVGPVVRDASASFDKYWNSALVYPIELLDPASVNAAQLGQLRTVLSSNQRTAENSRYATELRQGDAVQRLLSGDWPVQWSSKYRFVADDPLKVTMTEQNAQTTHVGGCAAAGGEGRPDGHHCHLALLCARGKRYRGPGDCRRLRQAGQCADQFARSQRRRGGARWLFASPQAAVDWRREPV